MERNSNKTFQAWVFVHETRNRRLGVTGGSSIKEPKNQVRTSLRQNHGHTSLSGRGFDLGISGSRDHEVSHTCLTQWVEWPHHEGGGSLWWKQEMCPQEEHPRGLHFSLTGSLSKPFNFLAFSCISCCPSPKSSSMRLWYSTPPTMVRLQCNPS